MICFPGKGWGFIGVLFGLSCLIVGPIFLLQHVPPEYAESGNLTHGLDNEDFVPNKDKRSLNLGRQEVRVEVGKDVSMEFYVDQKGSLTTWQSRTLSHYGIYWCRSPCWLWTQVIAQRAICWPNGRK